MNVDEHDEIPTGGTNFLVSAVLILKKQKKELQEEVRRLQNKLSLLEGHNAGLLEASADRLLEKH